MSSAVPCRSTTLSEKRPNLKRRSHSTSEMNALLEGIELRGTVDAFAGDLLQHVRKNIQLLMKQRSHDLFLQAFMVVR